MAGTGSVPWAEPCRAARLSCTSGSAFGTHRHNLSARGSGPRRPHPQREGWGSRMLGPWLMCSPHQPSAFTLPPARGPGPAPLVSELCLCAPSGPGPRSQAAQETGHPALSRPRALPGRKAHSLSPASSRPQSAGAHVRQASLAVRTAGGTRTVPESELGSSALCWKWTRPEPGLLSQLLSIP